MSSRKFKKGAGLILLVFLISLLLPGSMVHAAEGNPSSFVDKAEVDVRIKSDGSVDIQETFAFHFNQKKTNIPFDLAFPLEGEPHLQSIEFAREDETGEEKFIQIAPYDKLRPQPLAYTTKRKSDRIRIDLVTTGLQGNYLVRISYQWNRGAVLKDGRAVVFGPLLALHPDTLVETMKWTLTFPEAVQLDQTRISPVSIHPMTTNRTSESSLTYVDNQAFYKVDGIAVLISMPPSAFPLILAASDSTPLTGLFEQAESKAKTLSRLGKIRQSIIRIVVPLIATGLLIYLALYLVQLVGLPRIRKDFALWPATGSPAIVGKLTRILPTDSLLLLGTLLRLVNRKEIIWRDEVFEWKNPGRNDFSDFAPWEILLLQWLFTEDEAYDHVLAPERLRTAARDPDFRKLAHRFQKQIDEGFLRRDLNNARLTLIFRAVFIALAATFLIMTIILYWITHAATAFLLLIPAVFFTFGGITFRFLTRKGVRRYRDSQHFARRLTTPQIIIESCSGRLNDAETMISILPAAFTLKRPKAFFQGIRSLPPLQFARAAYALLYVYRRIPIPEQEADGLTVDEAELERLGRDLDEMERILSAWKEFFDSCFI